MSFILQPLSWVFLILVFSAFQNPIKRKKSLLLALLILFLFSNNFIYQNIARAYSSKATNISSINDNYTYAVILGGIGAEDGESGQYNFELTADRITAILPLYFQGKVKKIILSGGSGRILEGKKESLVLQNYLLSLGINSADIIVESESRNTYENAKNTAALLAKLPKGKVLLSTSCLHMPRAEACFKKQKITFRSFAVDPIPLSNKLSIDQYLIPNVNALTGWYHLLHEWMGYSVYKIKGYC